MVEANSQLPYSLDTLDRDKLQQVLERFAPLFPFPLFIISAEGTPVAAFGFQEGISLESLNFQVDPRQHVVMELRERSLPSARTLISAPIQVHGDLLGYVVGYNEISPEGSSLYTKNLRVIADFVGDKAYTEYELGNLTEELLDKYNEITLIYDISEALSSVLDSTAVCEIIIEKVVNVIGVGKASIMLYDETSHQLYIAAAYGMELSQEEMRRIRVTPDEHRISGKVFASGAPMLIEDIDKVDPEEFPFLERRGIGGKSLLSIPMIFKPANSEQRVMGVMNLTDKKGADMFTAGNLRLLSSIASQAAMSLYNIQLVEEVKDAEGIRREMEIAQQIQMGLLPGEPPKLPRLDLAGRCLPATQVGGDYYDFFHHGDQELGLVIADVSGHDVGSAFIMATARSALRSEVLARKSPARILKDTNFVLYDDLTQVEKFITMFYAEYDGKNHTLRYSNGAHNPPILFRHENCSFLDTEGMIIGLWDVVDFEEKILQLEPNDFVILYTDGVVEAKNEAGQMFTTQRLSEVIESSEQNYSATELLEKVYAEVDRFTGNAHRSDDITIVVLKMQT